MLQSRCLDVLAILMVAIAAPPVVAQEEASVQPEPTANATRMFGTLGLGVASQGVGGLLSLSLHSSRHVFVLRVSGASEFELFSPSDAAEDYALLYGRVNEGRNGWLRAALGPALVRAERFGPGYDCSFFLCSHDRKVSTVIGLALQAEAGWTPGSAVGLGLTAFGNLNPDMPYAGLALGLHLGRVRRQ